MQIDRRSVSAALLGALLAGAAATSSSGQEMPTFRIEMKDGAIVPDRLEVPAGERFKILIANTGTTPVEFESLELKREKAVAPGDEVPLVFRRLDPGEYAFFDDFHPGTKATLIAK
jgi:plastocyanin